MIRKTQLNERVHLCTLRGLRKRASNKKAQTAQNKEQGSSHKSLSPYRRQYQRAARQGPVLPRLLLPASVPHDLISYLTQDHRNILGAVYVLQQSLDKG